MGILSTKIIFIIQIFSFTTSTKYNASLPTEPAINWPNGLSRYGITKLALQGEVDNKLVYSLFYFQYDSLRGVLFGGVIKI